jgi:heat shock protein HslJ
LVSLVALGAFSHVLSVASFLLIDWLVLKPSSFVALLLLAVASSPACSTAPAVPTGPSSIDGSTNLTAQVGGTWTLTSIQPTGRPEHATPAPATYTMTLDGDRVSSKVDCNRCAGQMKINGNTITIGPNLACTKAACSTMEFESAYLSVLSGDSQAATVDNTLTLSSARGVLRFKR